MNDKWDKVNFKIKHNETTIKKNLDAISENSAKIEKQVGNLKAETKKGIAELAKKAKATGGRKSSNTQGGGSNNGGEGGGGGGPEGLTDRSKSQMTSGSVEKAATPKKKYGKEKNKGEMSEEIAARR